jgi:N-acetylneuraminic acid mutarotase
VTNLSHSLRLLPADSRQALRSRGKALSGIAVACFCVVFAFAMPAHSQGAPNEWTWMGGSNTYRQPGVYGTLGTPAPGNIPSARGGASRWMDKSGNFWLFGGGAANDLWEFNPSTKEWTWVGGNSTGGQGGVYGTLGVPAAGNIPGDRDSTSTWVDKNGNFWLFGGSGSQGYLNDLWEFDPSTNEWAWMSGSEYVDFCYENGFCFVPGLYGTLGTAAAGNVPGSRVGASSWTDNSGHLWLFGGNGFDANQNDTDLNDLWEFNPSTSEWAWMGGSSTGTLVGNGDGRPGVYGTLGTPAAGNVPGGRSGATSWTDSSGNFWLFGGVGEDAVSANRYLNDLWKFNVSKKEWTWMGGSSIVGFCDANNFCSQPGIYGRLGTFAASNVPGSRTDAASWADTSGNFWLFGGVGADANNYPGDLNDFWEYSPSTNEWAWMGGSSTIPGFGEGQPGIYGMLGTPAPANIPGGRGGAAAWTGNNGDLWMFGGDGFDANGNQGALNDLWENQPGAPAPLASIGSVYPASATAGGAAFYLTIEGMDFIPGAKINFGATALTTLLRSATKLTAEVPASLIATLGTTSITVTTAGGTSNGIPFAIDLPAPTIVSLSPNAEHASGPSFTLIINGTNFIPSATAFWWAVPLTTTYVNANQITAEVPSSYLGDSSKPVPVTVGTVSGRSNAAMFNVLGSVP